VAQAEQSFEPVMSSGVEFVGPFESYAVVVDGWRVPLLHAQVENGGRVRLVVDDRFGLTLSVDEAERIVPFMAQTIAIALGFTSHPTVSDDQPTRTQYPRPTRLVELFPDQPQSDSLG
jgi:hypothetical protein